jgi:DNA-binding IscR family transcriptional regulator
VARRHLAGHPPIALSQLAEQMHLPEPLVRHELAPFVRAELLVVAQRGRQPTYSLGRDVDTIHLGHMLRLLECGWVQAPLQTEAERKLRSLLEERVITRDAQTEGISLRELVLRCDETSPTP